MQNMISKISLGLQFVAKCKIDFAFQRIKRNQICLSASNQYSSVCALITNAALLILISKKATIRKIYAFGIVKFIVLQSHHCWCNKWQIEEEVIGRNLRCMVWALVVTSKTTNYQYYMMGDKDMGVTFTSVYSGEQQYSICRENRDLCIQYLKVDSQYDVLTNVHTHVILRKH